MHHFWVLEVTCDWHRGGNSESFLSPPNPMYHRSTSISWHNMDPWGVGHRSPCHKSCRTRQVKHWIEPNPDKRTQWIVLLVGLKSGMFHYQTLNLWLIYLNKKYTLFRTSTYHVHTFFIHLFDSLFSDMPKQKERLAIHPFAVEISSMYFFILTFCVFIVNIFNLKKCFNFF